MAEVETFAMAYEGVWQVKRWPAGSVDCVVGQLAIRATERKGRGNLVGESESTKLELMAQPGENIIVGAWTSPFLKASVQLEISGKPGYDGSLNWRGLNGEVYSEKIALERINPEQVAP